MASLLQLKASNDAAAVSAACNDLYERKELYLKYLIVSALNNQSFYVNISNSMFYSSKLYSKTKLFDFYVNNNLFDLVVLGPDSNEVLFDIIRDEIHANVQGYVVAKVDNAVKNVEMLGYFEAKDIDEVIIGKSVATAKLKPIENFANIEIIESPVNLEDVSERFFDLMSKFIDDDISDSEFNEFACLLYNSSELREVYSQVGSFDKLCSNIISNSEVMDTYFADVEPATATLQELPEFEPVYEVEEQPEITDIVETPADNQLEEVTADEATTIEPLETIESEDSLDLEEPQYDFELVDLPETEEETESDAIAEDALVEQTIDIEELEVPQELEETVPEVEEEAISDFTTEDDFVIENIETIDTKSEEIAETELDELEELNFTQEEEDSFKIDIADDIEEDVQPQEINLEFMDEQDEQAEAPVVSATETPRREKLSLVTDSQEEQPIIEHVEIPPYEVPAAESSFEREIVQDTSIPEVSEELKNILDYVDDDVVHVDDKEIMSILGVESGTKVGKPGHDSNEISMLYRDGAQKQKTVEFPGDKLVDKKASVKLSKPQKSKIQDKKVAIAAAIVISLALVGGTNLIMNGIAEKEIANTQTEMEEDYSFPIENEAGEQADYNPNIETPVVAQSTNIPENIMDNAGDTKIVSSFDQHKGSAPVILKSVAWQVPASVSTDSVFVKYLQIAGKNIKLNLASDLLGADDFAYNNKIKVSMTVRNNASVRNIKVVESSGSKNIDDIVLQSIKLTLKYINTPVMSADIGDKDILLVISI